VECMTEPRSLIPSLRGPFLGYQHGPLLYVCRYGEFYGTLTGAGTPVRVFCVH